MKCLFPIVVDDGSTDNSVDLIEAIQDSRLRLIKIETSGIEKAANLALGHAVGEYIIRVDADDLLLPTCLQTLLDRIKEPNIDFVYSNYMLIDAEEKRGNAIHLPEFDPAEIQRRGDFLATGTLYRKSIFNEIGFYDETVKNCGLENYYLILKLLKENKTGLHIPQYLFLYRRHDKNISTLKQQSIIEYGNEIFSKLGFPPYRTNIYHPYGLEVGNV